MRTTAVHIRDRNFAHSQFSSPFQVSKYITWLRNSKPHSYGWCVYSDFCLHEYRPESTHNVAWLVEPFALIPHLYEWLKSNHCHFHTVWTHDKELCQQLGSKAQIVPFGGCWVAPSEWGIPVKTKQASIIASKKTKLPGHRLRHTVIEALRGRKDICDLDVFGRGYTSIPDKATGLRPYRYHVVIENNRRDYYFTEKLIDSFVTGTIPIYYGCPSIGEFFNVDGMILFDSVESLLQELRYCTAEFYYARLDAVIDNFTRAQQFILAEDYIATHCLPLA